MTVASSRFARSDDVGGIIPILVTPFLPDGAVDIDGLFAEVEFLLAAGISWVGLGYGSEVHRMTAVEVRTLTGLVRQALGSRARLVGNVEMLERATDTCWAIERMADAGADAVLLRPVPAVDEGQDGMRRSIAAVARDAAVGVIVQDAPQHTGVELGASTLAHLLLDAPGVVAVKVEPHASAPKIGQVVDALHGEPGTVIGGQGGTDLVHELLRGAAGTMPGPAFPAEFLGVMAAVRAGDVATGLRRWSLQLPFAVVANRDFDTFLSLNKYVLVRRGVLRSADLRGRQGVDPDLRAEVDRLLDTFEVGV